MTSNTDFIQKIKTLNNHITKYVNLQQIKDSDTLSKLIRLQSFLIPIVEQNIEGPKFIFEDEGIPEIKEETDTYIIYRVYRNVSYNERFKDSKNIAYNNVYKKPKELYDDDNKYTDVPNSNKKSYADALVITEKLEKMYDATKSETGSSGFWVEWKFKKKLKIVTYKGKELKKGKNTYDMDVSFHPWWYTIDGIENKDTFDKEILELAGLMYHVKTLSIELIGHTGGPSDVNWTDGNGKITYEELALGRPNTVKNELVRILTSPAWNVKDASKRIITKKGNIDAKPRVEIIIHY